MSTSSTATRQTRPTAAPGDGADRDGFIENQLQRTSLHVKFVDLCSSLMVLAAGVLSFLLIVAVIDHWVLPLGSIGRWAALLALFVGVAYYFAVAVVPLLLGRINPIYAAHAIEQAEPSLKNSLINYLLFRSDRAGVRMGIYQALEQRAASDLSHVNAENAVDRSRMIKIGYVLVTVLVLCAAYTILAPKSPFQSVTRVLAPWADIARPSRVRIEDVQPGNAEVFQGQTLTVSARCFDLRDDEPVTLFYSSLDGQLSRQTLAMNAVDGGLVRQCNLPADSGGVQQDLVYWIQAGDATTPSYRVHVSPAPSILVEKIEYEFPPYTRLPNRVAEDRGDIQAIEGTRITLHARANQTIAAAVLEFDPPTGGDDASDARIVENGLSLDSAASHIEMTFAKQEAWCSFYLEMDESRLKPKHQSYHVRFLSEDGHANPQPVLHRLSVVRDLSPEIEILSPAVDRLEIPEDGTQRIETRAIDPDFGLSQVLLRAVAGGQQIVDALLVEDEAGQIGQAIVDFDFQPRALGLRAGDAVTYWAIAADNRRRHATGDATPNIAKSREYTFVILPPERTPPVDPDQPEDQPTDKPTMQEKSPDEETTSENGSADDQGDSSSGGDETGDGDESQESGESGSTGDTSEGAGAGEDSGTSEQSGASGGAEGDQSGGDSSDANTGGGSSSGNASADGASGASGGQSSSTGGNSTGSPSDEGSQNGSMSGGSDTAAGGAGGREEPLHDGEVFEKAMDYLRQKDDGRAAGSSDQPPGPDAEASDRPNDAASQQPSGSDTQDPGTGDTSDAESSPSDGQAQASGTGDEQGRPADEPAPGAEQSAQGAGKQKANQPGAQGESGEASKPQEATEQGGSPSTGSDSPQGQKKKSGSSSDNPGQSGAGDKREPKSGQGGQQESTSGSSSEKKPDGKKQSGAGGSQSQSSDQPETPSPSQPQSSSQGEESSDRSGGGGSGAGQGSNQAGTDAAGSNSPSDSGAGAAEQSGAGETSQNAGDTQDAVDATGHTGREPGSGSDTQPGVGGSGGAGAQGNSDQNSQTPPVAPAASEGQPNKDGPGVPSGGGMPSTGDLKGFGITGQVPPGEKPNVEYARKATDMVLEYLKDQHQDPDQALLDELGWSKEDMRAFVERWESLKNAAIEAPAGQSELEEALRSLGLRSDSNAPRSGSTQDDTHRAARNLGARSNPPSTYAEQFNAYRKGTARADRD